MSRTKRRTGIWPVAIRRHFADHCCAVCGSDFNTCIDHRIPLALGGSNDIGNLQVLCEPCNLHKGARKTDEEMLAWYQANKVAIDQDRRRREADRFNLDRF